MMQPLNKNTLFSIFESGDEEIYKEASDALKNPYVLMGMVLNGLQSYILMDVMYKRNYPQEYEKVSTSIKYKYYSRIYSYLTRINSDRFETIYTIGTSYEKDDVYDGLDEMRIYFESVEEYEKCNVIKKYIKLLTEL